MRIQIENPKKINDMLYSKYNLNKTNAIKGITIDSRLVKNGDAFIPLLGHNIDGHDFIENAIISGASLVFSEKDIIISNQKIKRVKSTYNCLKDIASQWRDSFSGDVIGITGSNGKTTTKELLSQILSSKIKCNYTKKNFNSTTGVPLSIIGMDNNSDAYIFELGMSKPGEIKTLCDISIPNIGLITNISGAHIKFFKSLKNIAKEKSSLFLSLSNNDTAFYNNDDLHIKNIPTDASKVTYSLINKADYSGKIKLGKNNQRNLYINDSEIQLPYNNNGFAYNALAAFSIADYLGINKKNIIDIIEKFKNPSGRGQIITYSDITVIDDTYNSNLESAKDGITNLSKYNSKHRTIAVIGDMLELGEKGKSYHQNLGNFISKTKINAIFAIGELSINIIKHLKSNNIDSFYFLDRKKLVTKLSKYITKNDVIYFKASRGMYLEKIIQEIFQ